LLKTKERKACHATLQPKLAALHVIGRHLHGRYLSFVVALARSRADAKSLKNSPNYLAKVVKE
jgi:hypothetical protein